MVFKVAVVDDELPARQRLEDLIAQDRDLGLSASLQDGQSAVQHILKTRPHLVLLDIQMPGLSGLEVIRQVGLAQMPTTVFVTAFDQFALKAFECCALDYLLKPYEDERFFSAINRAKDQLRLLGLQQIQAPLHQLVQLFDHHLQKPLSQPGYLERIPVKTRDEVLLLPANEISYIASQGSYCELHHGRKSHLIRMAISELEAQLNPAYFFRIHRSTLVNLQYVVSLKSLFRDDYAVIMRDGSSLRLSRGRRLALQKRLGMPI